MACRGRALNGNLSPVIRSVAFLPWNSCRPAQHSFYSRFSRSPIGCAKNVSGSWLERERRKEDFFVSFQHSHCFPPSHFPQTTSLTTLAEFLLGETLGATLICTILLTFAHLILPGHGCLYLVLYFLPEMQISCHKEFSRSVCSGEPYDEVAPEIVLWESYFSVSSCVCRAPAKGFSESKTVLW